MTAISSSHISNVKHVVTHADTFSAFWSISLTIKYADDADHVTTLTFKDEAAWRNACDALCVTKFGVHKNKVEA